MALTLSVREGLSILIEAVRAGRRFRYIIRIGKGLCRPPSYERYLPYDEISYVPMGEA